MSHYFMTDPYQSIKSQFNLFTLYGTISIPPSKIVSFYITG